MAGLGLGSNASSGRSALSGSNSHGHLSDLDAFFSSSGDEERQHRALGQKTLRGRQTAETKQVPAVDPKFLSPLVEVRTEHGSPEITAPAAWEGGDHSRGSRPEGFVASLASLSLPPGFSGPSSRSSSRSRVSSPLISSSAASLASSLAAFSRSEHPSTAAAAVQGTTTSRTSRTSSVIPSSRDEASGPRAGAPGSYALLGDWKRQTRGAVEAYSQYILTFSGVGKLLQLYHAPATRIFSPTGGEEDKDNTYIDVGLFAHYLLNTGTTYTPLMVWNNFHDYDEEFLFAKPFGYRNLLKTWFAVPPMDREELPAAPSSTRGGTTDAHYHQLHHDEPQDVVMDLSSVSETAFVRQYSNASTGREEQNMDLNLDTDLVENLDKSKIPGALLWIATRMHTSNPEFWKKTDSEQQVPSGTPSDTLKELRQLVKYKFFGIVSPAARKKLPSSGTTTTGTNNISKPGGQHLGSSPLLQGTAPLKEPDGSLLDHNNLRPRERSAAETSSSEKNLHTRILIPELFRASERNAWTSSRTRRTTSRTGGTSCTTSTPGNIDTLAGAGAARGPQEALQRQRSIDLQPDKAIEIFVHESNEGINMYSHLSCRSSCSRATLNLDEDHQQDVDAAATTAARQAAAPRSCPSFEPRIEVFFSNYPVVSAAVAAEDVDGGKHDLPDDLSGADGRSCTSREEVPRAGDTARTSTSSVVTLSQQRWVPPTQVIFPLDSVDEDLHEDYMKDPFKRGIVKQIWQENDVVKVSRGMAGRVQVAAPKGAAPAGLQHLAPIAALYARKPTFLCKPPGSSSTSTSSRAACMSGERLWHAVLSSEDARNIEGIRDDTFCFPFVDLKSVSLKRRDVEFEVLLEQERNYNENDPNLVELFNKKDQALVESLENHFDDHIYVDPEQLLFHFPPSAVVPDVAGATSDLSTSTPPPHDADLLLRYRSVHQRAMNRMAHRARKDLYSIRVVRHTFYAKGIDFYHHGDRTVLDLQDAGLLRLDDQSLASKVEIRNQDRHEGQKRVRTNAFAVAQARKWYDRKIHFCFGFLFDVLDTQIKPVLLEVERKMHWLQDLHHKYNNSFTLPQFDEATREQRTESPELWQELWDYYTVQYQAEHDINGAGGASTTASQRGGRGVQLPGFVADHAAEDQHPVGTSNGNTTHFVLHTTFSNSEDDGEEVEDNSDGDHLVSDDVHPDASGRSRTARTSDEAEKEPRIAASSFSSAASSFTSSKNTTFTSFLQVTLPEKIWEYDLYLQHTVYPQAHDYLREILDSKICTDEGDNFLLPVMEKQKLAKLLESFALPPDFVKFPEKYL
ncbi:unnamed protein product [Amoebophrya sp. A120]|nr:unnamed protein product [Amoebophrya sp. A120]|eukprot:GSA120T00014390001.1